MPNTSVASPQGGPSASDPVALATLIIADVKAYRVANIGNETPTQLGSTTIYDWSARDAENLAKLG